MLTLFPSPAAAPEIPPGTDIPGLYVHIPFCFHKCHYCDFYSITRQTDERMSRFTDLILREAEQHAGIRFESPRSARSSSAAALHRCCHCPRCAG